MLVECGLLKLSLRLKEQTFIVVRRSWSLSRAYMCVCVCVCVCIVSNTKSQLKQVAEISDSIPNQPKTSVQRAASQCDKSSDKSSVIPRSYISGYQARVKCQLYADVVHYAG